MAVGLGLGLAGLGLVSQGIGMVQARKDKRAAQSALDELSKQPYAKYSISPQYASFYSRVLNNVNNPQGMTPAERAAAQSGINTAVNTQRYNVAGASGGNLSRYISGALNNQAVGAQNQLAMRDAQMRQDAYNRNLALSGQAASQYQNVDNMNTSAELSRRMMTEQALGQSILQQKGYQTNTLSNIGSDLIGGSLMLGMGAMGGGDGQMTQRQLRRATRFTPPTLTDPNYVDPILYQ